MPQRWECLGHCHHRTVQRYLPTPPGSALHFANDGDEVELSFIAPIFFADHTMTLDTSGILVEMPVKFDSYDTEYRGGSVTIVPSLYALKEQTHNYLSNIMGQWSAL